MDFFFPASIDENSNIRVRSARRPYIQIKGNDPWSNGALAYYLLDQDHYCYARYSFSNQNWIYVDQNLPELLTTMNGKITLDGISIPAQAVFRTPENPRPTLSEEEQLQVENTILNSGLFKEKTEYLIIGDEPGTGKGVVDLSSKLGAEKYTQLKALLAYLPRQYLRAWFDKTVLPSLSSYNQLEGIVYGAFIEAFNEANLEHINKVQIDPWSWEEEKLRNYYLLENKPLLAELNARFAAYKELNTNPDSQATALMIEYSKLPKIADIGLEISRQFAVKELLARKDYESVKGIIEAYKYANYTILGQAISKPIPFDIISPDGSVIKATN
jgi:hypothetical protein